MSINIRNIAIIAHVDHGKTTLVDHMLRQSGTFRDNQHVEERLMDSMDLERERGITIAAKNGAFHYRGIKVNIVDTPGHSDFGGEVERVLDMVDGAILLVDASEGPLPQTRFVLKKALEQGLKVLVCINKIDRSDARTDEVLDEIFDLFVDLEATDEQMNFDVIYAIGREGKAFLDPTEDRKDLKVLLDYIVDRIPEPKAQLEGPLSILVANIAYNDYVGRQAVGRIRSGKIKVGDEVLIIKEKSREKIKVTALYSYQASKQIQVPELFAGDIAVVAGVEDVSIGDSLTSLTEPIELPRIRVDEPTVGIMLSINNGPFAGLEGKKITSRQIKERLEKELLYNVAIRVENTATTDTWKVIGRGELQLGILIETMRREGFEMLVSKPQVIYRTDDAGNKLEPMEQVIIDVEDTYVGAVTEKLGKRKGILTHMSSKGYGRTRLEFAIPARGLIGYRSEFLTDTRGTGLLNTYYTGYEPYKGDIPARTTGPIISNAQGRVTAYAIFHLEDRGRFFITAGIDTYVGMIVGENAKSNALNVNVCREKKLTNVRASGSDEAVRLTPVRPMTLEQAMEWIGDDELIEVTPKSIRLRCRELNPHLRPR